MAISNKMSILGTKKAVMAYNGGYYLPSVSDEGILSWTPTVEGMAPIPEVNVRGPQGPQGSDASVTAEAIQQVVPIAWYGYTTRPNATAEAALSFGNNARSGAHGVAIGLGADGRGTQSVAVGAYATSNVTKGIAIGNDTISSSELCITLGAQFSETVNGGKVINYCKTEGTGSITIGAGANTLNNGDTESSNSVTIGCKATNQGADSVVIGAQASVTNAGGVAIGAASISQVNGVGIGTYAKAHGTRNIAIGESATTKTNNNIALGARSKSEGNNNIAIGYYAAASGTNTIAIGVQATVSDYGATVIRSTAEDGTYTQLYFSGANTPLANTYANGEAIMGYVTTDSEGNMVASGFKRLSALFDEGTMTQPAILNEDGEWEQPKVFKPSDVDMEVEEPSEPEEYQPLPVYPIVEPEIPEVEEV